MDQDELDVEALKAINEKNPHRRAFARLRVNQIRLDALVRRPLFSYYQYYFEYLTNMMGYVSLGPDNHCYLTKKGGERIGLSLREINNPPDRRGQIQLFPQEVA